MGVIEDTGMSDRDKMETMIEVSGIHNGDSRSAHISRNFFNTIPIGPIYFLFTMDLKTGVMIPGHQQVDDFLDNDFPV